MYAVASVRRKQDGARRQPVLHDDADVEAQIGADIDEYIRLECGAGGREILQFGVLADLSGNLRSADVDGADQKVGIEIAADKIMTAMNEFVEWAVETPPQLVAPSQSGDSLRTACSG